MANPPDNNIPGKNDPQTPGSTGGNPEKPVQTGNKGSGGKPALPVAPTTTQSAGVKPDSTKPAARPALPAIPGSDSTSPPPIPGAPAAGSKSAASASSATGRRVSDSPKPTQQAQTSQTRATAPSGPQTTTQQPRSKLERPAGGTPAPAAPTRPSPEIVGAKNRSSRLLTREQSKTQASPEPTQQVKSGTRPATKRPLERPAVEKPATARPAQPAAARTPATRTPEETSVRRDRSAEEVTTRHRPTPGAERGRFVEPGARPASRDNMAPGRRPHRDAPPRDGYRGGEYRPENSRPPAYRDNRPRRRMAPPPGTKNGRYVAPAARPAKRGYVVPPHAAAPGGSAWGPLLFGLLLLAGVLWYAIKHYTPMIKADLTTRTNSALATAGYGDSANVEIDGRTAVLNGSVASESDSQQAEEVVANTIGVRSVDNQLEVGGTAESESSAERTQPAVAFAASDDGVELSGTVSDQAYADQIENHAKEVYGEDRVSGSITVDPNSTNPGWWPAVQQLTPDLNEINGSFAVEEDSLVLTGSAPDEQSKNAIGTKAQELLTGVLNVDNRITVEEAAAAPAPEPAPEHLLQNLLQSQSQSQSLLQSQNR